MINKDTAIYGSFAEGAGNTGCNLFNALFLYHGIDAIYRSFSVDSVEDAVFAARTLGFSGFAVTMPFKKEVLKYVDELSYEVGEIGAANTIINENGKLKAFNTDYMAAKTILCRTLKPLVILGDGGYAAAVKYAAKILGISYLVVTRVQWDAIVDIRNSLVYNCTPVPDVKVDNTNTYIDCLINTKTGKELSEIQARHQFFLYTGLNF